MNPKQKEYCRRYYLKHKEECLARSKRYREANKEKWLANSRRRYRERLQEDALYNRKCHLQRNFNLTLEEYDRLFVLQNGNCAICGVNQSALKRQLNVDHDHTTGRIRGLLCDACNKGIGLLKDDRNVLLKAAEYLQNK